MNGVTAATSKVLATGADIEVTQELALDPGENVIEVVAYNASNLLASLPARIMVSNDGATDIKKSKARKAIPLLDACERGALVAGHTQSRINQPASEAAIGRLHEATGRPILTAAASGKAAFEGYRNHGVLTWALLDALRNGDANGNGTIEVSELVAHVQNLVPKLGAELGSPARGWAVVAPQRHSPCRPPHHCPLLRPPASDRGGGFHDLAAAALMPVLGQIRAPRQDPEDLPARRVTLRFLTQLRRQGG